MADINSIVKIQIKRQSNNVTVRDLETILVLTTHTRFEEQSRYYTSTTDMIEDGFLTTDAAYKAAAKIFSQDPRPSRVIIGKKAVDDDYVTAITKQQAYNSRFLYVVTDATTDVEKEAIADYVETQSRMFYVFSDKNAATVTAATTDLFSKLKAKSYDRSFGIYYKNDINEFIEAAWVGRFSSEVIGSAVWIYKELDGCVADSYSASEEQFLLDKNANMYTYIEDDPTVFGQGKVVGGEWIDYRLVA